MATDDSKGELSAVKIEIENVEAEIDQVMAEIDKMMAVLLPSEDAAADAAGKYARYVGREDKIGFLEERLSDLEAVLKKLRKKKNLLLQAQLVDRGWRDSKNDASVRDVTATYKALFDHLRSRVAEDSDCFARERFWSLGESLEWPVVVNGSQLIYIRDAHPLLFKDVIRLLAELRSDPTPHGIAVLGNPGMGKSCFLVYCLVMFLFPPPNATYERKSVFYWYSHLQRGFRYDAFSFAVAQHDNFMEPIGLDDGTTICLFDGSRSNVGHLQISHTVKLAVAALSPSHLNDDQWSRESFASCRYLGPWCVDELVAVGDKLGINVETVRRRHLFFGGIARSVLASGDEKVYSAWGRLKMKIADPTAVSIQHAGNTNSNIALTMTHSVFAMIPSLDMKTVERVEFLSPKIHQLYVRTLREQVVSSMSKFLAEYQVYNKVASVWGVMFEDLAHEHLIGGSPVTVEWFADSTNTTVAAFHPARFLHTFYFHNLDEVRQVAQKHLGDNLYFIPYDKAFTGLDAIARRDGQWFGFQMTKNKPRPVIVARIQELVQLLCQDQQLANRGVFTFAVYWVVHADAFKSYPSQKLKRADGGDFATQPTSSVFPRGKVGVQCVSFRMEEEWQLLGDPGSPLDDAGARAG